MTHCEIQFLGQNVCEPAQSDVNILKKNKGTKLLCLLSLGIFNTSIIAVDCVCLTNGTLDPVIYICHSLIYYVL